MMSTAKTRTTLRAKAHPERFVRATTPQPSVLPRQVWIVLPPEKTTLQDAAGATLSGWSIPGVPPDSGQPDEISPHADGDRPQSASVSKLLTCSARPSTAWQSHTGLSFRRLPSVASGKQYDDYDHDVWLHLSETPFWSREWGPPHYRRVGARVGKAKAVTATARKLAVLFYNAVRFGLAYVDPGTDYYERHYQERVLHNLQRRARQLGYTLVETAAPSPSTGVS